MYISFKSFLFLLIAAEGFITCSSRETKDPASSMVEFLTSASNPDEWEPVKHQTSLGVIEGRRERSVGLQPIIQHYYAFRGIPYAHAPVGDLRFADPVDTIGTWPGKALDGTRYGSVCLQFNTDSKEIVGDEDCLFLNVFTPALPGTNSEVSNGLPVLVFIHGGGFIRGSSSVHAGGRLAGQNIVLVTINYRLGALGFLSTEDEVIPGNFGILDQVSALRWVQRNIADFGGDPKKVTVGGFSAGASSAHMHFLSPLSKGLFRSVILASGSAYCSWATQRTQQDGIENFAEKISCPLKSSAQLKSCLQRKTKEELLRAQAATLRYEFWPVPYAPTIDAGFRAKPLLPVPVAEMTQTIPLPALIVNVPHEGMQFAMGTILLSDHPTDPKASYNQLVRDVISSLWFRPGTSDLAGEAAETFYYSERSKTSLSILFEEMTEALSDYLFHACVTKAATKLTKAGSPVYSYLFTHRDPETPIWSAPVYNQVKSIGVNSPLVDEGISHGDNMAFIFRGTSFDNAIDEKVAHFQISNWASFVTNGTPAVAKNDWPALVPGGPVLFYNLSSNPHMLQKPFREKEINFWLQTLPFLEKNTSVKEERKAVLPWIFGAIVTLIAMKLMNRNN